MIRITVELTEIDDTITFEGSAPESVDFLLKTALSVKLACLVADELRIEEK